MNKVKVKAVGHGFGYNRYPVEFHFFTTEDDKDEIRGKAIRRAKDATACDCVTITEIDIDYAGDDDE